MPYIRSTRRDKTPNKDGPAVIPIQLLPGGNERGRGRIVELETTTLVPGAKKEVLKCRPVQ